MINAPFKFRQSEGELYFCGEVKEGKHITAWEQIIELLEVADGTALKALKWMHEQEVIGYCARKNGAGIRIFLNRAVSSIKRAAPAQAPQNFLPVSPVASGEARVSRNAMPFKKEPRKKEDTKINTFAPKNGAAEPAQSSGGNSTADSDDSPQTVSAPGRQHETEHDASPRISPEVVAQLRAALEPTLRTIAAQTAAREASREGERTRRWLDQFGIPKAARVAQREAYNIFKHQSSKIQSAERLRADLQVGRSSETCVRTEAKPLTANEITDLANGCVAVLEVQGKAIAVTLAEISVMSGGWVIEQDISKVREAANALLISTGEKK